MALNKAKIITVTGVKGGNATVTAKAALDANVKGSYVVEVVESEDFNEVVVLAKDEVVSSEQPIDEPAFDDSKNLDSIDVTDDDLPF